MPSELDPLLPANRTAPEISGYGFSNPSRYRSPEPSEVKADTALRDDEDDRVSEESDPTTAASPLRTIIALFTVVVGVALLITLLIGGGPGDALRSPDKEPAKIKARVKKVLSDNPLIGL